jgi:FMN phosphatase YigB (HAD superfamily)
MAERPLYIFDLDGTLADCKHRQRILDEKYDNNRWRRFYAACDKDAPIHPVIQTMERLRRFADVWIFSGRSAEVRDKTVAWLTENTSFMSWELETALMMRQEGDHRADDIVKREWLDGMLWDDRQRLVATFDDRDRVVAMWRAAGVPCFQVAPGDF